jgi:hypothetical protein
MVGKIIKYYAIARAPKLAFTVSHPRRAARLAKTGWDLKHAWAPRIAGVAALAIALPVGYALGRLRRRPVHPRPPAQSPDEPWGS